VQRPSTESIFTVWAILESNNAIQYVYVLHAVSETAIARGPSAHSSPLRSLLSGFEQKTSSNRQAAIVCIYIYIYIYIYIADASVYSKWVMQQLQIRSSFGREDSILLIEWTMHFFGSRKFVEFRGIDGFCRRTFFFSGTWRARYSLFSTDHFLLLSTI